MRLSWKTKQQTDKPKPVLTNDEKKENKNTFPTTTSIIVLCIQIALYKLQCIKLTVK